MEDREGPVLAQGNREPCSTAAVLDGSEHGERRRARGCIMKGEPSVVKRSRRGKDRSRLKSQKGVPLSFLFMTRRAQVVAEEGSLLAQGLECHSCDLFWEQDDQGRVGILPNYPYPSNSAIGHA